MMKEVVSTMSSIGKSASKIADIINVIDSIVNRQPLPPLRWNSKRTS